MKKLFILSLATLGLAACSSKADYIVLTGKVDGLNGMPLDLKLVGGEVESPIKLMPDGTFRDTLRVPTNYYTLIDPQGIQIPLYLQQGDELGVNIDLSKMPLTVKFTGKDTIASAYLQKKADFVMELQNSEDVQQLFDKKPEEFKKGLEQYAAKYTDFLKKAKVSLI